MCADEAVLEKHVSSTPIAGVLEKHAPDGGANVKYLLTTNASQIPIAQVPLVMFVAKEKLTEMAENASLIHVLVGTVQQTETVVVKGNAVFSMNVLLLIARNAIDGTTVPIRSIVANRKITPTSMYAGEAVLENHVPRTATAGTIWKSAGRTNVHV